MALGFSMQNRDSAEASDIKQGTALPAEVAHDYIREMLAELAGIAETAQLSDLSALLNVTLKAVDIKGHVL